MFKMDGADYKQKNPWPTKLKVKQNTYKFPLVTTEGPLQTLTFTAKCKDTDQSVCGTVKEICWKRSLHL
jgi:phosphatidylethanolamine-binding protein (PEBP) family uncharacterized protein